jgi:hypothetical protein
MSHLSLSANNKAVLFFAMTFSKHLNTCDRPCNTTHPWPHPNPQHHIPTNQQQQQQQQQQQPQQHH